MVRLCFVCASQKCGSQDLCLNGSGARVDFVWGANFTLSPPPPMEAPEVESSVNRLCFVCASRIDYSEDLCLTGSVSGEGPSGGGGQLHPSPPHDGTWGRDPHESFVLRLCLTDIWAIGFVPRSCRRYS